MALSWRYLRDGYRTLPCACLLAMAGLAFPSVEATAEQLQLKNDKVRREQTPAYIENLKRWDNTARYNVERVADHDRQAFKPDGLRMGNFYLFPEFESRITFDDNVFRTHNDRRSDVSYDLMPRIKVISRLPRHVLDFTAGAKLTRYSQYSNLDTFDAYASAHGALHINHAHVLYGNVRIAREHEDVLATGEPVGARERTPVIRQRAKLALRRDAGRMHASAAVTYDSLDFDDVRALDGTVLDQDRRDSKALAGEVRVGYRFSPGFELQGKVRGARLEHRSNGGVDPDGNRYEVLAGLDMETGPLLRWRFVAGYSFRTYDQADLDLSSGYVVEANMEWLPTQTITLRAGARRHFEDAIGSNGERGTLNSTLNVNADFELKRNLVFTIKGEYRNAEYIGSSRVDDLYTSGVSLRYFHAKNWFAEIGYDFVARDSSDPTQELRQNKVWGGVKIRF